MRSMVALLVCAAEIKKPISWFKCRLHTRIFRDMGIMAIDTIIASARATTEIPITVHSAVRAMFVSPSFLPMALRAQRHDIWIAQDSFVR